MSSIVVGLGYGDEGKGRVVDALCRHFPRPPMVIRFCGGQQAGHKVVLEDGREHDFSHYGSGTLYGAPTYWSQFCTMSPDSLLNEREMLKMKFPELYPDIHIHRKCPVTTPYDVHFQRSDSDSLANGTVGMGVGTTWQREEDHVSLLFEDLLHPTARDFKIEQVRKYYNSKCSISLVPDEAMNAFHHAIEDFYDFDSWPTGIYMVDDLPKYWNYIFEGSQGILLDQRHGFFPHVTRSNTDTTNARELCQEPREVSIVWAVTRAYQTRHGFGPMTNPQNLVLDYTPEPRETNKYHRHQGEFRVAPLDLELLAYAKMKDERLRSGHNCILVITCVDQLNEYTFSDRTHKRHVFVKKEDFLSEIQRILGFPEMRYTESTSGPLKSLT